MKLVVLVDYRHAFWSSTTNVDSMTTMNLVELESAFAAHGVSAQFMRYSDIDLTKQWEGIPVVYTSAEDPGLLYKSYIEDCVLALDLAGARLIPGFAFLRAHHNKVFMEMLRKVWFSEDPLAPKTREFGVLEDLEGQPERSFSPAFVKKAEGAGSSTVALARNEKALLKLAQRASHSGAGVIREYAKRLLRSRYVNASTHRGKFIVQSLIPELAGDFKVLRYGSRYFAVYRRNRTGDPRASGAGRLDFRVEDYVDPSELLGYASSVALRMASPCLSMDIAFADGKFYLLEFQALSFGPAALELSNRHWMLLPDGEFDEVLGPCRLEWIYAEAVCGELSR